MPLGHMTFAYIQLDISLSQFKRHYHSINFLLNTKAIYLYVAYLHTPMYFALIFPQHLPFYVSFSNVHILYTTSCNIHSLHFF